MYTLVVISIACAVANNIVLHALSTPSRKTNPYLTNAIISAVWVVALLLFNWGWKGVASYTYLYALLYGVILTGFIFFKTMAMATGPIALTALIGCSGFIVTTTFNVIYWKDPVNLFNAAGMLLMIAAIFMINYPPGEKNAPSGEKTSLRWKIYSAMFFVFAVATGIFFRFQQHFDKPHTDEMMILAALFTTIVLLGIYAVSRQKKKAKTAEIDSVYIKKSTKEKWKTLAAIVVCGLCSCAYNRMNMYNTGALPNTIFFPIFNGGVVILSFLSGWLLFKEKTTKLQFIGVSLGIFALIVFSRFFGIF